MYLFELQGLLIFGLPIWIIIRIITLINKRKEGIKLNIINEIFTNLFVLYLIFLIGITILPVYIGGTLPHMQELSLVEKSNINILPFVGYFKNQVFYNGFIRGIIRNVVGNLVLLIPFILFLCWKNEKFRSLKSSIKAAFLISLSIELIQLFMNICGLSDLRTVDIEDLILNTLGGVIAWGMFTLMYKIKTKSMVDNVELKQVDEN